MTGDAGRRTGLRPSALLVACVRLYQAVVSPLLGPRCRFEPSCSAYAVEALQVQGAGRGLALAVWRLLRCQPFTRGGYDPVPEPRGRAGRAGPDAGDDGHAQDDHPHDHRHDDHRHDDQPHDHHRHDSGASVPAGLPSRGARPC